jgi:fumarate reductase subunit D
MDKATANRSSGGGFVAALVAVLAAFGIVIVAGIQCVGIVYFANTPTAYDPLLPAVAFNIVCGVLQALLFRLLLPLRYREPRAWSLLLLGLACTFVPLLGGLVVLVSCIWAACYPASHADDEMGDVPAPEFVTYLMSRVSHGGGARLQARLVNTKVAAADRLSALVAIQNMPTRTTGTLLRDLLADPVEDVRLIAYGTLDQAENDVMQRIFHATKTLETAQSEGDRHAINRQLAELYFELIYQNLVQGVVYRHTLEQADRHARAALEIDAGDAALWMIRGRLALTNGAADEAAQYMDRAQSLGFPRERLVPWLAEVEYLRGDYARVSELLASLGNAAALPMLKPVARYWST